MKRGIIRIILGIVMIALQILGIYGAFAYGTVGSEIYTPGYYSVGIGGIILLVFGLRAYKKGLRSQLVLHTNSGKLHTAIKWVSFAISTLLFISYLVTFVGNLESFPVFTLLMLLGFLSFSVYLLFYAGKKPSCLLSTSLILIGSAYINSVMGSFPDLALYLAESSSYVLYILIRTLPKLAVAILYIIIAVKLYRESFSAKTVRVLGAIAFALEMVAEVLLSVIIGNSYYFFVLSNDLFLLFLVSLLLYTSVFKLNTLKENENCCNAEEMGI